MSERNQLDLNIYGVTCTIVDRTAARFSSKGVARLRQVFDFFVTNRIKQPQIRVVIAEHSETSLTRKWRKVRWQNGPSVAVAVGRSRRLALFSQHSDVAAYIENYLHSAVGEILEARGWFRLHAAGIVEDNLLRIWHAPRGAGKSVRTRKALLGSENKIAGDEIVLFHHGKAYPYPVPIAEVSDETVIAKPVRRLLGSTKGLYFIDKSRVAAPSDKFIVNTIVSSNCSKLGLVAWLTSVTLGLGLPQMRVYLIRLDTVWWLPGQALRRFFFGWQLFRCGQLRFVSRDELRGLDEGRS